MRPTTLFRTLIQAPPVLRMPAVHDALAARLAELAGIRAVCVGGYGASASLLGRPDVNLLSMTEMADQVARIAEAVAIPVFADADTGHGNATNAARTVRRFERAGAAGVFLEDQVAPKRCGHMAGKAVVPLPEMLAKVRAAADARSDPDFVLMGRTDALAVHGLEAALERAGRMAEAGCDAIFVEAPRSLEEMLAINAAVSVPSMAVYIEGGLCPLLTPAQYEELGFALVAYGCSTVFAAAHALREVFASIAGPGTTEALRGRMVEFAAFNELLGLSELRRREAEWAAAGAELAGGEPQIQRT